MRLSLLSLAFAAAFCAPAYALTLDGLSETELRQYTALLAGQPASSRWQQLWARTRLAGHFDRTGPQPRFTLPMREIPALVRQTLADPHHLQIAGPTQSRLRRDFAPQVTGLAADSALTAICLVVDWRGAPEKTSQKALSGQDLFYVSLTKAQPC